MERTLAKFFRMVELQAAFSTPCAAPRMAALPRLEAVPVMDRLTPRASLPKTLESWSC
ncbi:hypothetical protein CSIRO_0702 [Bradyrhizobiaceae bacterium SG-6C]|nr:hypothetical protein CSIRO_0702 [Bradyrhizobiaceae bacterium SG-6C]